MEVMKVSAESKASAVAGALAGEIRGNGRAELQVIGAGALNQAVKAVAIARGFLATEGRDLVCVPAFANLQLENGERTAIKLLVFPR